jgi:hypothetical protein
MNTQKIKSGDLKEPMFNIRPYCSEDKEMVREICRKTAFRNQGYDLYFEDGELFADYWTRYYLDYNPQWCYVTEKDRTVVGYLLGSHDFKDFERVMKKKILPRIFLKLFWRMVTLQYSKVKTYRYIRWVIFKSWREMPNIPVERFPAHYHLNILPKGAFHQGFSGLLLKYLDDLEASGIPGLYGIVLEPGKGGWMSRLILKAKSRKIGVYDYFKEYPTRMGEDILGDPSPMKNRIYGCTLDTYRKFVTYARDYYRF